jgi:hypothetical protein
VDTSTNSISYNTAGTVVIVGNTSGTVYWSNTFTTATPSFNAVNASGITFYNASIGNRNYVMGGRKSPGNDYLAYGGNISGVLGPIQAGPDTGSYANGVQCAVGTVTQIQGWSAGVYDNILLIINTLNNAIWMQVASAFYFRVILQVNNIVSMSLDQTVATALTYTPTSGTTLSSSVIYMASLQAASNIATAPGGIGVDVMNFSTGNWKKVLGNPNNIKYLCAGEDLRAFAITDVGTILICNNISTAASPSDWVTLPLNTSPPIFSKIYYRKTLSDIAYAIDTSGNVYMQTGINNIFKKLFNLTA